MIFTATPETCQGVADSSGGFTIQLPDCATDPSLATTAVRQLMFQPWADDMKSGLVDVVRSLSTFWMAAPSPSIGDAAGPSSMVADLQRMMFPISGFLMVAAMIFGFVKMGIAGHAQPGKDVLAAMLRYLIVCLMGASVVGLGLVASNGIGEYFIERGIGDGGNFGDNLATMFEGGGLNSLLLYIGFLILAVVGSGLLYATMLVRGAILVVLVGQLPIAASFTNTEAGKTWFSTSSGWIVAFLLVDPAAGVLLGTGFKLMSTDAAKDGIGPPMIGVIVLFLAVVALPAMLRLVAPATKAVASGKGLGSMIGAAAMTAGTVVATGAMSVARSSGGGASGAASAPTSGAATTAPAAAASTEQDKKSTPEPSLN